MRSVQGGPKNGTKFYMPIISSNINRFSKLFTVGISKKFVATLTLNIPPPLVGVVSLPCEMSDIALKPATTMTNAWSTLIEWLPNSLNLNPVDYATWGDFS